MRNDVPIGHFMDMTHEADWRRKAENYNSVALSIGRVDFPTQDSAVASLENPITRGAIRILIADDHPTIRQMVKHILTAQPGFEVVGEARDGQHAVTLAESCFASSGLSAQISLTSEEPDEYTLFGERGARAAVSVTSVNLARVRSLAAQYEVAALEVGRVARGEFRIELNGRVVVSADVSPLADAWGNSIERAVASR